MNADGDRDRMLEHALTRELRRDSPADGAACLDAETLAAWMDGGLDRDALAVAEAHAAECSRCRAMLATFGRTAPVESTAAAPRRLWRWWLAPLAAATGAAVLWVVVPSDRPSSDATLSYPARPSSAPFEAAPAREADAAAAQETLNARGVPEAAASPRTIREAERSAPSAKAESDRDTAKAETRDEQAEEVRRRADAATDNRQLRAERSAEPAAPQPAPPSVAAFASAARSVEVVTPDPAIRWRALAAGIERSTDGGRTWQRAVVDVALARRDARAADPASTAGSVITGGSAPSSDVCWLVGNAGVVLLTTDALAFRRLPFPEQVDLILVTAKDARVAAVTTVDGRVFETVDAGLTWRLR